MKQQTLRLAVAVIAGVLVLVAACTSAQPTVPVGEHLTVQIGPVTFQLPRFQPGEVQRTDVPAVNDAKIFQSAAPTDQPKALDRASATDQSEYVVGATCGHDH